MHSHRRPRGRISFEVLCALLLAGSFAAAWQESGISALLASASVTLLFSLYWSAGLFARDRAQPAIAAAEAPAEAADIAAEPAVEIVAEPEPVAEAKPKRPRKPRAAKRKAEAAIEPAVPAVEQPAVYDPPSDETPHIEPLFDPQPYVRQVRPAFGRKSGPLPIAPKPA